MSNIRHLFHLNKGFSIIEFIIGFSLASILLSLVFSILITAMGTTVMAENKDEVLLHGRFALEYLNEEIRSSDLIISSDKIEDLDRLYPNNIGFVVMEDSGILNSKERYNFATFYINNGKMVRISTNKENNTYPKATDLKGYNEVCEYVLSIDNTSIFYGNQLLNINLLMGMDLKDSYNFKSTIFLNLKLDYR